MMEMAMGAGNATPGLHFFFLFAFYISSSVILQTSLSPLTSLFLKISTAF